MNAIYTFSSLSSSTISVITKISLFVSALLVMKLGLSRLFPQRISHNGAGILPYCIKNSEVYFLLSKEGYGPPKNTWCDFGGKADPGESATQTAAREGWEESRGILGNLKTLQKKISSSPSIGLKRYKMFFLKIDNPFPMTNRNFIKRKFSKFCQMEKTEIAWVKASDVFKAVRNQNQIRIKLFSYFWPDKLRGFFAKTISDALNNPQERKVLENITQIPSQPLIQAS